MAWDRIANLLRLLADYMGDDTTLRLHLLAIEGCELPELAELLYVVQRIDLLLNVHLARLCGDTVSLQDGEYVVTTLPRQ